MTKPRFTRPPRVHRGKNTKDARGRVKVIVELVEAVHGSHRLVKGNIMRTLTVGPAKVSAVFKVVNTALLPDD